jgi:hypothetical protein
LQIQIVNGIPCFNCTEAERAKKYGSLDPKAELGLVDKKTGNPGAGTPDETEAAATIVLKSNDARNQVGRTAATDEPRNQNQPRFDGDRGTALNFLV